VSDPATLEIQWWAVRVTLLNSCITAAVAIVATWAAHRFTDDREQRKEVAAAEQAGKDRVRERLEQMITALYEYVDQQRRHGTYVATLGICSGTGSNAPDEAVPTSMEPKVRAEMLQRLYFPEWANLMSAISAAEAALAQFWVDELAGIAADANHWRATRKNTYSTRQGQPQRALTTAVDNLADAARDRIAALSAKAAPLAPVTLGDRIWAWVRRLAN
jgi:hypothetical protein